MKSSPSTEPGTAGLGHGPINVSETGAELSYMVSRALGYAALAAATLVLAAQLF